MLSHSLSHSHSLTTLHILDMQLWIHASSLEFAELPICDSLPGKLVRHVHWRRGLLLAQSVAYM
jgi:hypothetical protein